MQSSKALTMSAGRLPDTWNVARGNAQNDLHWCFVNEHQFHGAMGKFSPLLIPQPQTEFWSWALSFKKLGGIHTFWAKEDENTMVVPFYFFLVA